MRRASYTQQYVLNVARLSRQSPFIEPRTGSTLASAPQDLAKLKALRECIRHAPSPEFRVTIAQFEVVARHKRLFTLGIEENATLTELGARRYNIDEIRRVTVDLTSD